MTKFRKLLLASAVSASMGGLSGPANAIIEAAPGEALLVPFVLFTDGDTTPPINTLVEVTVPAVVGIDTVPNWYTAPNTTPTNAGGQLFPPDPDLGPPEGFTAGLHLYFFDEESNERFNTTIETSPDDLVLINWGDIVEKQADALEGVKGYFVITNEKSDPAVFPFGWESAAKFAMRGDAFMVFPTGIGLIDTKIPVLPMSDGFDFGDVPTVANNVIHEPDGSIIDVSPLSSGIRTNLSDGDDNFTLFDLVMSNRFAPTLHVIWVDDNIGQNLTQFVYNDEEEDCSYPIPIEKELNVWWTSPEELWPGAGFIPALPWVSGFFELCYPDSELEFNPGNPGELFEILDSDVLYPGFVRYRINEYVDNNLDAPESSAVAFSIQLQVDVCGAGVGDDLNCANTVPQFLPVDTALAHERGLFD